MSCWWVFTDYENCKCLKKLVDELVEVCTENVEEAKIAEVILTENIHKCSSCTLYIKLLSIIFTINVGISTYFINFHWYLKKMLFVLSLVPLIKNLINL